MHPNIHRRTYYNSQIQKQPKCPSSDEWIKQYGTYIQCNITQPKQEWNNDMCAMWMDLEIIIVSEVGQREKDKYNMISLICGI